MALNPSSLEKVLVRATNWLGDAVMSLPALRALRDALPRAHLAVVARPSLAELYAREECIDRVIPYPAPKSLGERRAFAARLRDERFDAALLFQNAFDAAWMAWLADIPVRIGYHRDGRGPLLTHRIPVPEPGDIPRHERFYYLELLRRAGLMERFPAGDSIRLARLAEARASGARRLAATGIAGPVIGISPGAAYGNAKRWLPERFAHVGQAIRRSSEANPRDSPAVFLLFGSPGERPLCETVASHLQELGLESRNLAGETTLGAFIDLAAACRLFLTNDSGAMHVASALGVPTVAVFGATDDSTTGPTGPLARVVREHAECSPCLLRECPIDHRCMTRVTPETVAAAALQLLEESAPAWTHEARS
ncbi:MAG: lipopolysaccharide heptosyltransferase II [Acidobacteriia bacterium]|nr:lipopolysaccharide heptosyltransferase II [Terriglobia bacterium]